MSRRYFEWALFPDAPATSWRPLDRDISSHGNVSAAAMPEDGRPDWFISRFTIQDDEGPLECHFLEWFAEKNGVARFIFTPACLDCYSIFVYAREVPGSLVFSCTVSIHDRRPDMASAYFEAVFSTIAGNRVLWIRDALPALLLVEHMVDLIAETAEANGILQSRNQGIRLLFNGQAIDLPEEAVLWHEPSGTGWLQAH